MFLPVCGTEDVRRARAKVDDKPLVSKYYSAIILSCRGVDALLYPVLYLMCKKHGKY